MIGAIEMEHALELGGAVSKTTETPARPPAPNFFDVVACETTKSLLHPVLYQGLFVTRLLQGRVSIAHSPLLSSTPWEGCPTIGC